jgi:transcriptional regulator with XRE-family HTH domain
MHERLLEERERLGFTQEQFAAFGGIKRRAQVNYESGERSPDGNYFSGISAAGADVQYILTGVRSANALTADEVMLLNGYRSMNTQGKSGVLGMISGMTQPANPATQQFNGSVGQVIQGNIKNNKFNMPKT